MAHPLSRGVRQRPTPIDELGSGELVEPPGEDTLLPIELERAMARALVQGGLRAVAARGLDRDSSSRDLLALSGLSRAEAAFGYALVALVPTLVELLCGGLVLLSLESSTQVVLSISMVALQLAFRAQSAERHEASMALLLVTRMSSVRLFCGQLVTSLLPLVPVWLGYAGLLLMQGAGSSAPLLALVLAVLGGALGLVNRYGLNIRFERGGASQAAEQVAHAGVCVRGANR
ncbi:MAG: hypothetical protein ACYCW6_03705 [Candidatus Xenobia bacterium]